MTELFSADDDKDKKARGQAQYVHMLSNRIEALKNSVRPELAVSVAHVEQLTRALSRGDTSLNETPVLKVHGPSVQTATKHATKGVRRDILTPVIEHAQSLCKDQWDTSEVWGQLHKLASQQYLVLLHPEGKAIAYTDGDDTKFLTRKKLAGRLKRKKSN